MLISIVTVIGVAIAITIEHIDVFVIIVVDLRFVETFNALTSLVCSECLGMSGH